ncbi:hypothetical protein [Nocardioides panacisoli]|uniref:Uncharacterized protein n=1 Tax=Nocardioides panacisoli TaxID=627624 RepID=A0ABP7J2X6_9ACTN
MLRVPVVLVAGVLALSSCSSGDPAAEPRTGSSASTPVVAPLDVAWHAAFAGTPFDEVDDSRGDALWSGDGDVSIVTSAVTTYDAGTGERRSVVDLPGKVCAISREVNADGVGAVALGRGCRTVVAVDTRAGKIVGRWETGSQVYLQDVSVGDRVVVAADASNGAYRFDLRSGRPLPRLGPGSAASDGVLVVVASGPTSHQDFEVYDQDSGRLVRKVAGGVNTDVFDIVDDRPLLVAAHTNDVGNHVMDLSGREAVPSGREIDVSYPNLGGYEVLDGTLFLQYGGAPVVDAWDGDRARLAPYAVLHASEAVVGTHDGRLVTVETSGDPLTGGGTVVRAVDPDDPEEPIVLGAAGVDTAALLLSTTTAEVVGDVLVTPVDDELVALTLPDDGVPQSDLDAAAGLGDGDYTPADAADLCPGLRPATLEAVGIRAGRGGYRADCALLDVDTDAFLSTAAFASTADGDLDPVDVAEHTFANTVKASGTNNLPPLAPLPGLGDQAAWGDGKQNGTGLLVRVGNVTVIVQGTRLALARGTSMKEALRAIGEDLVAELDRRQAARLR